MLLKEVGLQLYSLREETEKDFCATVEKVAKMGYTGVEFAGYGGLKPAALAQLLLARAAGAALGRSSVWYLLLDNFVIVACSEELAKFLPVRLAAWNDPAFDYRFDAIVYSVSSALGFAAVENILYVLQSDLRTAVSRAILSVPGHFFFAVSMGLLLSRAKQAECRGQLRRGRMLALLALAVPALLHGAYDFIATMEDPNCEWVFLVFVLALFTVSVRLVRVGSRNDRYIDGGPLFF